MTRRSLFGLLAAPTVAKYLPKSSPKIFKLPIVPMPFVSYDLVNYDVLINKTSDLIAKAAAKRIDEDMDKWWTDTGGLRV